MITTVAKNERKLHGWKFLAGGLCLALAAMSGTATARDNVSFSISFGTPAPVYAQVHAYSHPQPVYYAPPRVVYVQPRVVYAQPHVVYYPAPQYAAKSRGHGGNKHWNRHHGRR